MFQNFRREILRMTMVLVVISAYLGVHFTAFINALEYNVVQGSVWRNIALIWFYLYLFQQGRLKIIAMPVQFIYWFYEIYPCI